MKVLIQQPTTGLFYKGAHEWVPNPDHAMEFQDTLQAYDFCAQNLRDDAQIFLRSASAAGSVSIKPSPAR